MNKVSAPPPRRAKVVMLLLPPPPTQGTGEAKVVILLPRLKTRWSII